MSLDINSEARTLRAALDAKRTEAAKAYATFDAMRKSARDEGVDLTKDDAAFGKLDEAGKAYDALAEQVTAGEQKWAGLIQLLAEGRSGQTVGVAGSKRSEFAKRLAPELVAGAKAQTGAITAFGVLPASLPDHREARFLSEALSRTPVPSRKFEHLRIGTPTYAAAAVAELGTKPTSDPALSRAEASTTTIAHVSEPFSRQILADLDGAVEAVDSLMRDGLLAELDDQLINGNGTAPNLTGIVNTAGIGTQALGTDTRTDAVHKALTKIRNAAGVPGMILLHPDDWEQLVLEKSSTGAYLTSTPSQATPVDAPAQRLWGLPVVVSLSATSGTGLVFGAGAVELAEREGVDVSWNEGAAGFVTNSMMLRAEGRWGIAVIRPAHVVEVTGL